MKKLLFLAAVAVLTIASCTKNEVVETPENAVNFGIYVGNSQTRGTITDLGTLGGNPTAATTVGTPVIATGKGFGVNAVQTVGDWMADSDASKESPEVVIPNFMYDQEIKGTATSNKADENNPATTTYAWSYSPIKYWPTNGTDKISFFAWAPYGCAGVQMENQATATTKANEIAFTLQTDPKNMVDFVAANAIGVQYNETNAGKVDFTFKHTLSRVRFTAVASEDLESSKSYIVVKSAKLNTSTTDGQIYASGTFTFANVTNDPGTWTVGSPVDNSITTSSIWNTAASEVSYGGYTTKNPIVTSKTTQTDLFATGEYLFLIPVAGEGTTKDKNTVTFDYDIVTVDENLAAGYAISSASKTVSLPEKILKQGVAYNVTFNIGVNKVEVGTVTVEPWKNSQGTANQEDNVTADVK